MSDLLLSADQVTKSFASGGGRIDVLRGLSFAVRTGETVSIRGESGSGKSTLLNLLTGLDAPDTGAIRWEGTRPIDGSVRGRSIGIVFQSFYLIPELTALENILMAARIIGRVDQATQERAEQLLREVGLHERASHIPSQLSGGERQRIAVARALVNRPRLIVADEPTGNLDEQTGDRLMDTLFNLCATTGTALVLVTHNVQHARRAQRQYHLIQGQLHVLQ